MLRLSIEPDPSSGGQKFGFQKRNSVPAGLPELCWGLLLSLNRRHHRPPAAWPSGPGKSVEALSLTSFQVPCVTSPSSHLSNTFYSMSPHSTEDVYYHF